MERLQPYLDAAGGERMIAYQLYTLNSAVSEALYQPLQMLEVALRNRFHFELSTAYGEDWYDKAGVITNIFQRKQIKEAKQNLITENKSVDPGRIVASLSFGFWTACLGRHYEDQLWRKALHKAFKNAPKGMLRRHINRSSTPIRVLRNRVAHHEPILKFNLPSRHAAIIELTSWLSTAAAEWADRHSRFRQVYDADLAELFQRK